MNHGHLSDDRLIELCLEGTVSPSEVQHLSECGDCDVRRVELNGVLTDVTAAAIDEADAAFPAERLARQQARILSRIEQDGRPGRVIAFPASRTPEPVSLRTRPATRWVAAAAAAGLIVGLVAGHLTHDLPVGVHPALRPQVARQQVAATTMREASVAMTDDEFLGEVEQAIDSSGPAALRPIDALTPRAWEVR